MTRIDGPGNINNNIKLNGLNNVGKTSAGNINSTFGDGFGSKEVSSYGFIKTDNTVPPELLAKFDFEPPKKIDTSQLTIADKDYIPDKSFEEKAYCEV